MSEPLSFHVVERRALALITAAWLAYGLIFLLWYPLAGEIVSALVLVPVFVSAWFGGMAYALLAAAVSFSYNAFLFLLAGIEPMGASDHVAGNVLAFIFALGVGYIGEIRQRLGKEVEVRKGAEARLALLNSKLDEKVRARSQELVDTNLRLSEELDHRKAAEFEVSYREAILSAVAHIAEMTLKADSWEAMAPEALQRLGQAARVNRVYLFKNLVGPQGQVMTSQIYEWDSPGTVSHAYDQKLQNFDYRARGFQRWEETLSQGQYINNDVVDMPAAEREFLGGQGVDSILIVPVMTGFDWWGSLGFDSVGHKRLWSKAEIEALLAAASVLGASILREEDYERTLLGWAKALELRDEETEGHTQRVTQLAVRLAEMLGCDDQEIIHIRRGALLHDIGKMGVPDDILRKPGPLTQAEWEIMRRHPLYARDMLAPVLFLAPAISIPFSHHERWDGSGYPLGLSAKDIPFAARIFAVVDVWDALSSDRPYRPAWEVEKVSRYIKENSGTLFDPEIVPVFFEMLETYAVKAV